jgi:hypothetical protein
MKQRDYLNGWWHLLPNICLLTAIIGQFDSTALNSPAWGRISIAPLTPKTTDRASTPIFSTKNPVQKNPVQLKSPTQQPAI